MSIPIISPERRVYNFIKEYLADKTHITCIEIGTLHTLMTKNTNSNNDNDIDNKTADIDGINRTFPWRARGHKKWINFLKSIPGLKWSKTINNNHSVSINLNFTNIEQHLHHLETIKTLKIKTQNQRIQRRIDRKRWRTRKQLRSFHSGFDVLSKLSFLTINNDINKLRNSFYSKININYYNNNPLNNISWNNIPSDLCPEKIILSSKNKEKRGTWKKYQIEFYYEILRYLLIDDNKSKVIVDFGCGSGNIGLCLAYLFPFHQFILIDYNPYCIAIAKKRLINSNLTNIKLLNIKIEDFNDKFDIGIACHACGNATDYAQLACFNNNASYILCSCCVGKIKYNKNNNNNIISYPRSNIFSNKILLNEFEELSRVADHNETDFNHNNIDGDKRKLCKTVLELDRCLCSMEYNNMYQMVLLTQIIPYNGKKSSSPKNDVIIGIHKNTNSKSKMLIAKLFNNKFLNIDNFT